MLRPVAVARLNSLSASPATPIVLPDLPNDRRYLQTLVGFPGPRRESFVVLPASHAGDRRQSVRTLSISRRVGTAACKDKDYPREGAMSAPSSSSISACIHSRGRRKSCSRKSGSLTTSASLTHSRIDRTLSPFLTTGFDLPDHSISPSMAKNAQGALARRPSAGECAIATGFLARNKLATKELYNCSAGRRS